MFRGYNIATKELVDIHLPAHIVRDIIALGSKKPTLWQRFIRWLFRSQSVQPSFTIKMDDKQFKVFID
jgi:hypothetical protein